MASLTFYGGVDEIGGNRLLLADGKTRILLDFGTSFSCQGDYFHEYLNPRKLNGLGDYFATGLAPDLRGVYRPDYLAKMGRPPEERGVDGVLVSHAHIDHIGLIPFMRPDIPVYVSAGAEAIMDTLEQTGGAGNTEYLTYAKDFQLKPGRTGLSKVIGVKKESQRRDVRTTPSDDVGDVKVTAYDVDHSLPGARGWMVETSAGTLAYTGDFRFHGRSGKDSQHFVKKIAGVDVLVTEGTNMGVEDPETARTHDIPEAMSEEAVRKTITEAVAAEGGFVAVNYPVRDLDRVLSFWQAAQATSRRLLLTTKQAWMMRRFKDAGMDVPALTDRALGIYIPRKAWGLVADDAVRAQDPEAAAKEYAKFEREFLSHPNAATAADVAAEPARYLVPVDLFSMTELVDLAPKDGAYIFSKTEPFNDEMDIDQRRLGNWIDRFNLRMVKAHASGHASRPQLEEMIDTVGPRRIVPVHTLNANAFTQRFGDVVRRPTPGGEVVL